MRNKLLCTIAVIFLAGNAFALDSVFVGIGPEVNAHTRNGAALGGSFLAGIDLNKHFATGVKFGYSNNLDTVSCIEPQAFFRYSPPLPLPGRIFLQAEAGSVIYFEFKEAYPAFSGGLALGWRFNFGGNWFAEPAFRGGYPYKWAFGAIAGYSFPIGQRKGGMK